MGQRLNYGSMVASNDNPGPANYNADYSFVKQKGPQIGFGSSLRGKGHDERVPGPGQYDPRPKSAKTAPKCRFGTGEQRGKNRFTNKETPGPGNYESKSLFDFGLEKGMGTTMISRKDLSRSNANPGPADYQPGLRLRPKSPSYKIGTERRLKGDGQSNKTPGPGHYEQFESLKNRRPTDVKFGRESRDGGLGASTNSPGPGHYDPNRLDKKAPEYIMGLKPRPFSASNQPGPSDYSPNISLIKESNHLGGRIGSGIRTYKDLRDAPGPGQYDIRGKIPGPTHVIGTQSRGKFDNQGTPGPGHYELSLIHI